jgi:hypothetical protein
MQIDDAIRCLKQAKKRGSQNVIFAFWEQDMFELPDDGDWADACEWADEDFDWSQTHEALEILIESKRCEHGM